MLWPVLTSPSLHSPPVDLKGLSLEENVVSSSRGDGHSVWSKGCIPCPLDLERVSWRTSVWHRRNRQSEVLSLRPWPSLSDGKVCPRRGREWDDLSTGTSCQCLNTSGFWGGRLYGSSSVHGVVRMIPSRWGSVIVRQCHEGSHGRVCTCTTLPRPTSCTVVYQERQTFWTSPRQNYRSTKNVKQRCPVREMGLSWRYSLDVS